MSAFFVGAAHVNAILSFVNTRLRGHGMPCPDGVDRDTGDVRRLTEIGKALLAENIASLRYRYPDSWAEQVDIDVNGFEFRFDAHFCSRMGTNLPIAVCKLCDCYDYQSCEHDGWKESFAKRFSDYVRGAAFREAPGYASAPWVYYGPEALEEAQRLAARRETSPLWTEIQAVLP